MTMEPSKEFVKKCLELANEFLRDAKLSLKNGRLRSAIYNAYYAMYHAAQAVLSSKGFKPKTHSGLRELFGREFVQKGLVDKDAGKSLSEAFNMRQASTYDVYAEFREEKVENIVTKAEAFVRKMNELIK